MSEHGGMTLSAVDFLKLAEEKRVARVDLAKVGRQGVVFVVELSSAKQMEIFNPKGGKRKVDKHGSVEVDLKDLPLDSAPKLMEECMVTDAEGGAWLQSLFHEAEMEDGAPPEFVVVPADRLVYMKDVWLQQHKTPMAMRTKLKEMPNAVVSLIAGVVNRISGTTEDDSEVEEKKDS